MVPGQLLLACNGTCTHSADHFSQVALVSLTAADALVQGPGYVPLGSIDGTDRARYAQASKQAAKFFGQLARFAVEGGISVDILAAGAAAVNTPLLGRVATESGGVLLLHRGQHRLSRPAGPGSVPPVSGTQGLNMEPPPLGLLSDLEHSIVAFNSLSADHPSWCHSGAWNLRRLC